MEFAFLHYTHIDLCYLCSLAVCVMPQNANPNLILLRLLGDAWNKHQKFSLSKKHRQVRMVVLFLSLKILFHPEKHKQAPSSLFRTQRAFTICKFTITPDAVSFQHLPQRLDKARIVTPIKQLLMLYAWKTQFFVQIAKINAKVQLLGRSNKTHAS